MPQTGAVQSVCLYCKTELRRDREEEEKAVVYDEMNFGFSDKFTTRSFAMIGVCPICGWWKYTHTTDIGGRGKYSYDVRAAVLKKLDDYDSLPLDEIRKYLIARYEWRFDIHPSEALQRQHQGR